MRVRAYQRMDQAGVVALWDACNLVVPWNDPVKDIERKLNHSPQGFLVGINDDEIVASVMFGYDGHRGSVNYLAVLPQCRGMGFARQLMDAAAEGLQELGCPKINLMVRQSNLQVTQFYEAIDYTNEPVVVMGKRLIKD